MPIRYIGRQPTFKGKFLYEICKQLRDSGVGRIVYRTSVEQKFPNQKSYYRLTKVIPDMTCAESFKGTAWGEQVFRGKNMGLQEIKAGYACDWIMVPKEEEKEFCATSEVFDVDKIPFPTHIDCPPLLEIVVKQNLKAKGKDVPHKVRVPFVSEDYKKDLMDWHFGSESTSY